MGLVEREKMMMMMIMMTVEITMPGVVGAGQQDTHMVVGVGTKKKMSIISLDIQEIGIMVSHLRSKSYFSDFHRSMNTMHGNPNANRNYWCVINCQCVPLWSNVCVIGSATNAPIYIPCPWKVSVTFYALVKPNNVEFAKSLSTMICKN